MTERDEMVAPCPFCGAQPVYPYYDAGDGDFVVMCASCGAHSKHDDDQANVISAWNTRSAARTDAGYGAIKPLVWDKHPDDEEWYSIDEGHYQCCDYIVYHSRVSTTAWCLKVRGHLLEDDFDSAESAKAAAQADYEQRIRSAIAALPAPGGNATGWQAIETAPKGKGLIDVWTVGWGAEPHRVADCYYDSICDEWRTSRPTGQLICVKARYVTHWQPLPPPPTITRKSQSEERS